MLLSLFAASLAYAGSLHAGIPVRGVPGFGAPSFQTVQTGWSAVVLDGFVRVYVGKDEADATAWVARMKTRLRKEKPTPNPAAFKAAGIADVHGNGSRLILFRKGNIGICVRHKSNARPWAAKAVAAIVDEGPPSPAPPTLIQDEQVWTLSPISGFAQVDFEGGTLIPGSGYRFSQPPKAWTAWDRLGRSVRVERPAPQGAKSTAVAE